jgi:hypothetical protein
VGFQTVVRPPLLVRQSSVNLLTQELNPLPHNAACRDFLLGILIFKGLTARLLYKSIAVKGLMVCDLNFKKSK